MYDRTGDARATYTAALHRCAASNPFPDTALSSPRCGSLENAPCLFSQWLSVNTEAEWRNRFSRVRPPFWPFADSALLWRLCFAHESLLKSSTTREEEQRRQGWNREEADDTHPLSFLFSFPTSLHPLPTSLLALLPMVLNTCAYPIFRQRTRENKSSSAHLGGRSNASLRSPRLQRLYGGPAAALCTIRPAKVAGPGTHARAEGEREGRAGAKTVKGKARQGCGIFKEKKKNKRFCAEGSVTRHCVRCT